MPGLGGSQMRQRRVRSARSLKLLVPQVGQMRLARPRFPGTRPAASAAAARFAFSHSFCRLLIREKIEVSALNRKLE